MSEEECMFHTLRENGKGNWERTWLQSHMDPMLLLWQILQPSQTLTNFLSMVLTGKEFWDLHMLKLQGRMTRWNLSLTLL
ncbi:hypothetical protein AB205_0069760 [Aquarana catesbeiana]|uniref:Uncharacterized protein n=1 Tax=Aquarana catesbeiana TaxID=8400 RepID=A0A2G9RKA1_AQUCT|nr:hypothetical protein AB205_0069760 [Aquarana catesbeiana]